MNGRSRTAVPSIQSPRRGTGFDNRRARSGPENQRRNAEPTAGRAVFAGPIRARASAVLCGAIGRRTRRAHPAIGASILPEASGLRAPKGAERRETQAPGLRPVRPRAAPPMRDVRRFPKVASWGSPHLGVAAYGVRSAAPGPLSAGADKITGIHGSLPPPSALNFELIGERPRFHRKRGHGAVDDPLLTSADLDKSRWIRHRNPVVTAARPAACGGSATGDRRRARNGFRHDAVDSEEADQTSADHAHSAPASPLRPQLTIGGVPHRHATSDDDFRGRRTARHPRRSQRTESRA